MKEIIKVEDMYPETMLTEEFYKKHRGKKIWEKTLNDATVICETEEHTIYEITDGLFTARFIKPKKWSIKDIFENCIEREDK